MCTSLKLGVFTQAVERLIHIKKQTSLIFIRFQDQLKRFTSQRQTSCSEDQEREHQIYQRTFLGY